MAGEKGWEEGLIRDEKGKVVSSGHNILTILRNDLYVKGCLKFNTVNKQIEMHGSSRYSNLPENLSWETLFTNSLHPDYGMRARSWEVAEQILAAAEPYNPIEDYLRSLRWDGVERIDTLFARYFKASLMDSQGVDISGFVRTISRKWLLSAIARVFKPGEDLHTVLILEGPQGIGKSMSLRVLAGQEYLSDTPIKPTDKDHRVRASKFWFIELAELSTIDKSDIESWKTFITATHDDVRPPYGRKEERYPRRCVFVGTTNKQDYLIDLTGNRRFWPVWCPENIDLEALRRDRDQLWAEALIAYTAGETWFLTREEQATADWICDERLAQGSPPVIEIQVWWYGMPPATRPDFFTTREVAIQALGALPDRDLQRSIFTQIGIVLSGMGFKRRRVSLGGVRVWGYMPTQVLKNAPQKTAAAIRKSATSILLGLRALS